MILQNDKQINKQSQNTFFFQWKQLNIMKFNILSQNFKLTSLKAITLATWYKQNHLNCNEANFSPSCIAADRLDIAKIVNNRSNILCRNQQFGITAEAQNIFRENDIKKNYIKILVKNNYSISK